MFGFIAAPRRYREVRITLRDQLQLSGMVPDLFDDQLDDAFGGLDTPRFASEDRAVSSNRTPSATIPWRTSLSRDFVAKKREEFAAFRNRPLHLGARLAPKSIL
jgi:hypothetical protein